VLGTARAKRPIPRIDARGPIFLRWVVSSLERPKRGRSDEGTLAAPGGTRVVMAKTGTRELEKALRRFPRGRARPLGRISAVKDALPKALFHNNRERR